MQNFSAVMPVQPLCLVVIDLVKRTGGQPESKTAEGVLNVAGTVQDLLLVTQNGVTFLGIDRQHQGGKAGNGL